MARIMRLMTHESHESHETHESHESHETRQPREGRSRSYSFYTVCIDSLPVKISKFTLKYTKSFEHVFIMSKIRGPRYEFEAISFEPNSLLRISEISEMLQSEFGSKELVSK